ncbi:hypothetical protein STCU_08541 [Strigomonas culicis]|uniref:Major facilitator superfamily (MFS) profile domain-containing protein n=1 Tax=Strigomonas culicis TaxID=28005 RepID=S9TSS0_9TRYP|nr:hypothetical protein STCU_08541 [Strigomonas culicis]|eukprot:EPY21452.1 hypothetical protein STCU_08541 [Strigomonas culicis]
MPSSSESDASSTPSSTHMRDSMIHVPPPRPFVSEGAGMLPSTLTSPTRSVVELSFQTATFSKNNSFNVIPVPSSALQQSDSATPASAPVATALTHVTNVKVNILPAVIGYFGYIFGCAISAFYSLILKERSFSPQMVGVLIAIIPLFSLTLLPVLSYMADKYRATTSMLTCCAVISVITVLPFTLVSSKHLLILVFIIIQASCCPMNPLLDQHTLLMFPKEGRSTSWSYVRSFGAYGWGIGCVVGSVAVEFVQRWYVLAFQYALGQAALLYCIFTTKPYEKAERTPVRFFDVLRLLKKSPRVLLFLFAACLMGMGYSFINNFLFMFLDDLGGNKVLMGFTVLLTVSTEVPLFQMSERLLHKFTERQMMSMAMLIWVLRVVGYSLLTNAWQVLLLEPLHGVTFAFMWLPSVHVLSKAFPPHLSSSATGVLFMFSGGVGPFVGNLVAGALYSELGPRMMFRVAASVMLVGFFIYQGVDRMLERRGVPLFGSMGVDAVVMREEEKMRSEGFNGGRKHIPPNSEELPPL